MLKLELIGNLGADARLEVSNGGEFVAFNVAHTEKIKKADGAEIERTTWVSCTINGKNEKLLPYLKKGTKVFCWGDPTFRTFHSEKQRQLVVGVNLFVRSLELVGAMPDLVPRVLFTNEGVQADISKYYWCSNESGQPRMLYSQGGGVFVQDANGFIIPVPQSSESPDTEQSGQTTVGSMDNSYFGEAGDQNPNNVGSHQAHPSDANSSPNSTLDDKTSQKGKGNGKKK